MLEAGIPFAAVAKIMGWSAATTVRMTKRYGHLGDETLRAAVEAITLKTVATAASPAETAEDPGRPNPQESFDNPFDPVSDQKGDISKLVVALRPS